MKVFKNCISFEYLLYIKLIVSSLKNLGAAASIHACGYIIFLNAPHDCKFFSEICLFFDEEMHLSNLTRKEINLINIKNYWNENKTLRILSEDLQPSYLSVKELEFFNGWHLFSSVGEIFLNKTYIEKATNDDTVQGIQ